MLKALHILILALCCSLTLSNNFGQGKAPMVKFDAKITSVVEQGTKLDVVRVFVSVDGLLKDSSITQNGRMFYDLDTGKIYKIEFSKSGYVSKHLIVSTKEAPENIKLSSKLKVEVSLFKYKPGLKVDFLKSKPVGVARYDDESGKLDWDKDYTRSIIEQIISATLELYDESKTDE